MNELKHNNYPTFTQRNIPATSGIKTHKTSDYQPIITITMGQTTSVTAAKRQQKEQPATN